MKKITNLFDDILKLLALFTFILLITGFIDLKTHYGFFGINISQYISASEILIASVDNILIVLFFVIIQLMIWLTFFNHLFTYTEEDILTDWKEGEIRPKQYDDETIRRFVRNKKLLALLLVFWGILIILSILRIILPYNKSLSQISIFAFTNCMIVLLIYMGGLQLSRKLWILSNKQDEYHPKLLVSFLIFLPVLMFSIWFNSHLSANHIRKYGNKNNMEVFLENNIKITTSDSIRYIGRNENYLFFWNKNNWETKIYPSGQVKEIINSK